MEVAGWLLDKSAAVRADHPDVREALAQLGGIVFICQIGALEQLYSARSAEDYDVMASELESAFGIVKAPEDVMARALTLQRDLAHHHGMWHRTPIPDLLIAETALHLGMGVLHVGGDFERIAEVRPLVTRRFRL